VAVAGFILAVLLTYKLRALAAVVTTLSLTPRAAAVPTELNYFLNINPPKNVTSNLFFLDFKTDWFLDLSVIFILAIILLVIIVKIIKSRQRSQHSFDVYMQTGHGTKSILVWLKKFQLAPHLYSFTATNHVEHLDVIGILLPKLYLTWPGLRIYSNITAETYTLPRHVSLTWTQARVMRQFHKVYFWCLLVAKTPGGHITLLIPQTGWNQAPPYPKVEDSVSLRTMQTTVSAPNLNIYPPISGEGEAETSM